MDQQRFDDLTRSLAAGASRRRVLGGMAGGAVAGLLGMFGVGRVGAQQTILPGGACSDNAQCSQTGGPVFCADNGIATDGALNCCRYQGGACTTGSGCCGALKCADGVCVSGVGTLPLAAACNVDAECNQTGGAVVCADNGIANDGGRNCCRNQAGVCTSDAGCCAGLSCVGGICGGSANLGLGAVCTATSQCAQPATGGAVRCADNGVSADGALNCCRDQGGACTIGSGCCSGLACVGGFCGGSTTGTLLPGAVCTVTGQCSQAGGVTRCGDNGLATDGALNCCRDQGGACSSAAGCCSALQCVGGVCGGTTSPPPPPGGTVAVGGVCTATSQCDQTGGATVCADNGLGTDGALNCCRNAGGACTAANISAGCCGALLCVNGVCGGTTSPPPPPPGGTVAVGGVCTATSQCDQTGGTTVCADNGLGTDGALNCCRNAGGACTTANNSAACCGGLLCVNGTCGGTTSPPPPPSGGTVGLGGICTATTECAQPTGGAVRCGNNGLTGDGPLNCCRDQGGVCTGGAGCCDALECVGGVCGGATSPPPPPGGTLLSPGAACTSAGQCSQVGGAVVCADNGLGLDGALNCCRNQGGACTDANFSAGCCGGLLCRSGTCQP